MSELQASPEKSVADPDAPLPYLERIRDYYLALGYDTPYRWAHYDTTPFHRLTKPLGESRLSIITTAAPYLPDRGDQGPGAPYNGLAKFFSVYSQPTATEPDLRISHIAIDRDHTTAEDQGSYFPLRAFQAQVKAGRLGSVAPRFHGLPTNRSHRITLEEYCPELVARCVEDGANVAVLVPNCPVCHQSITLAARALEEAGIASVIMGCARDIVEFVGAPRLLFSDFPLGNAAGRPNDPDSQVATAGFALDLFESAQAPGTVRQSPLKWLGAPDWKRNYSNAALLSEEELAARRLAFDQVKVEASKVRDL